MKRCPECRRDFYDDTLSFCLDDGTPLVEGPANDEPATAIQPSKEPATAIIPGGSTIGSNPATDPLAVKSSHREILIAGAVLLVITTAAIGFAVYKYRVPEPAAAGPFQSIKIERLTSNGKATQAVISPDGKQVVYVLDDGGQRSLWLRQVATATDVQLTQPTRDVFYFGLTISRDGNYLYYIFGGLSVRNRVLYQMPLLGGSAKKVIEDVGSPIGLSPDGKQIAFARLRDKDSAMIIANADGSNEREVATRTGGEAFGSMFGGGVAWSADGTNILSVANKREDDRRVHTIVEVSITDGSQKYITSHVWYEIQRIALLPDGSGLVVTAAEAASEYRSRQLWYVPYPSGEPRKITNDLSDYTSISLNSESNALVAVQEDIATSVWIAPEGDASRAAELRSVSGKLDGYEGVAWTPDGRILYTSMASGNEDIWIMDADGKNRKQLTTSEDPDFWPSVSVDGRYITFTSERGRGRKAWIMDIDGNNPRKLFAGNNPLGAGDWIIFGGTGGLTKAPLRGGEHVKIDSRGQQRLRSCAVSPDARRIACQTDNLGERAKLAVLEIEGTSPAQVFDVVLELPGLIRWTPDGRAVTFVSHKDGERDIWSQPIEGGEPKRLTNFKTDQIFGFDWSRDKMLVISHGKADTNVVLIRNTK